MPDKLRVIVDRAIGRGILNKRAENCTVEFEPRVIADLDLDPQRLRAGLNHGNRLWMTIVGNKEGLFAAGVTAPGYSVTKRHRFCSSSCFVQHGSVCDVAGSEIYAHVQEVQRRFEPPLRDFR